MDTLCAQYIPSIYMIETYLANYQIDKWNQIDGQELRMIKVKGIINNKSIHDS